MTTNSDECGRVSMRERVDLASVIREKTPSQAFCNGSMNNAEYGPAPKGRSQPGGPSQIPHNAKVWLL